MALSAVEGSQRGPVRVHPVQVKTVFIVLVIPTQEDHPAIRFYQRRHIVAHVEGDLLNIRTVRLHHMQGESAHVAPFLERIELGFAFIQQARPGLTLASGGKDNAAIGQVGGVTVLALFSKQITADQAVDPAALKIVFPNVPGGLLILIRIRNFRCAGGKQQSRPVRADTEIANIMACTQPRRGHIPGLSAG